MAENYPPHPYAELFPLHDGPSMWELRDDLKENGQTDNVVLYFNKATGRLEVLDGRRRQACLLGLGMEVNYTQFKGDDAQALAFVISKNLRRRHLGEAERAMVAATIARLPLGSNQHTAIAVPSQSKAAEMLNISVDSVQRAKKVQEGTEQLKDAVKDGTLSLSDAANLAKKPPRLQRLAVKRVRKGEAATATEAVEREAGDEPPEETIDETIKRINHSIESFCRKLMKMVDEECPSDHWLTDMNRRNGAIQKFKDGCETLRAGKCSAPCPKCEGKGHVAAEKCRPCHGLGRLPKLNLEAIS